MLPVPSAVARPASKWRYATWIRTFDLEAGARGGHSEQRSAWFPSSSGLPRIWTDRHLARAAALCGEDAARRCGTTRAQDRDVGEGALQLGGQNVNWGRARDRHQAERSPRRSRTISRSGPHGRSRSSRDPEAASMTVLIRPDLYWTPGRLPTEAGESLRPGLPIGSYQRESGVLGSGGAAQSDRTANARRRELLRRSYSRAMMRRAMRRYRTSDSDPRARARGGIGC